MHPAMKFLEGRARAVNAAVVEFRKVDIDRVEATFKRYIAIMPEINARWFAPEAQPEAVQYRKVTQVATLEFDFHVLTIENHKWVERFIDDALKRSSEGEG